MPWIYQISSGMLVDPNDDHAGDGYSGNGSALNDPSLTDIRDHGPCPRGRYTMGPWFTDPEKGPIVTHLVPDATNEMYGRSGFMIHGDNAAGNHSASDGCIILPHPVRAVLAASDDQALIVTS